VAVVETQAESGIKPAKYQCSTSNNKPAVYVVGIPVYKKVNGSTGEDSNALGQTIFAGLPEWLQAKC